MTERCAHFGQLSFIVNEELACRTACSCWFSSSYTSDHTALDDITSKHYASSINHVIKYSFHLTIVKSFSYEELSGWICMCICAGLMGVQFSEFRPELMQADHTHHYPRGSRHENRHAGTLIF